MRALLHALCLFAVVVLVTPSAGAQVCEGDVRLGSQAEVDAFDCTVVTGQIDIVDYYNVSNPITNLDSLAGLTSVGSNLRFYNNSSLTDLTGLSGITSVDGSLSFLNNDALTSLAGLDGITSVGGFGIGDNDALTDLTGLSGITSVEGSLGISDNDALTDLTGLGGITSFEGALYITGNDRLADLTGLGGITSVYVLEIRNNRALTSLSGLEGLVSVEDELAIFGELYVKNNAALTNVDALASLTSVSGDLSVRNNASLAECTVGLGALLRAEEEHGDAIGGGVGIGDNAPGCNSKWEAMGGNVDSEDEATPLVTGLAAPYPNPTAGAATLTYSLAEPSEVTLTLYDALGRRVRTLAEGPQSAGEHEVALGAGLPAGTYVVRFEADDGTWTERVTVVR